MVQNEKNCLFFFYKYETVQEIMEKNFLLLQKNQTMNECCICSRHDSSDNPVITPKSIFEILFHLMKDFF